MPTRVTLLALGLVACAGVELAVAQAVKARRALVAATPRLLRAP